MTRQYDSREDAEQDRDLDLRITWKCSVCGRERIELPHYNEGGNCDCGGEFQESGVSYKSR